MQVILRIFKELFIAVLMIALILGIGYLLFKSQIPFLSSDVPNPVKYASINKSEYSIVGDLENETDPTKSYETTNSNLRELETERRVHTGAPNPFVMYDGTTEGDLPTEKVTIQNQATPTTEKILQNDSAKNGAFVSEVSEDGTISFSVTFGSGDSTSLE